MYEEEVEALARALGADTVGFADLSAYEDELGASGELLARYPRAISVSVALLDDVVDTIRPDGPSPLYAHHYRQVNALLDQIILRLARFCRSKGYRALPVPPALISDWDTLSGPISHKAVAVLAGLGWMGKSTLVITPEYGPRMRFATVLTDMPLEAGEPMECRCGPCRACVVACPAGAIKDVSFKLRPARREDAVDVRACMRKLEEFARDPSIGELVCGVCVKVCPFGRRGRRAGSP